MAIMDPFAIFHNCSDRLNKFRQSRSLVLLIVFVAIFLDNMLLTTVVPVVPNFLRRLDEIPLKKKNSTRLESTGGNHTNKLNHTCIQRLDTSDMDSQGYTWYQRVPQYYVKSTVSPLMCQDGNFSGYLNDSNGTDDGDEQEEVGSLRSEHEDVRVGVLFASKAVVQLITNPFIGPLTNRIGYTIPMFTGFVVMTVSTIIFAFGESYVVLFIARSVQGIGSSCSSVAGMGMLACYYPDDKERGNAMGIALGGLALGVLLGPPFGGVMYEFTGKETPFLILAFLAFADGCLQLVALRPSLKPESQEGSSLKELIRDPAARRM